MTRLKLTYLAAITVFIGPSAFASGTANPTHKDAPNSAKEVMAEKVIPAEMSAKESMTKKSMEAGPMEAGSDIHNGYACNANGVALSGIDVVSYHTPTGPLMGNSEFETQHADLTYRFLSQAHLDLFLAKPERYLPRYFGWCATSLALGALTCPNPLNYKLEDGQLLLFETTGFTNGKDLWNADPKDYRRRADGHQVEFLSDSHPDAES